MGEDKKQPTQQAISVEFRVSMHCKACEKSVVKALSKVKGVERISTDVNNHKAIATGRIKPEKALKKLMKKTGKRAEIVVREEEPEEASSKQGDEDDNHDMETPMLEDTEQCMFLTMFSDENPNACSLM